MTTLAFDTLRYARRLREAGVPEPQAEVQAELMAEAFGFYADNLLTRDHFTAVMDARFSEQDARTEQRFAKQDAMFEARFSKQDAMFEARFAEQSAMFEARLAEQSAMFEARFARLDRSSFLHTWMLGTITVVLVVPQLQSWLQV